tara:strand:+ start:243 stop:506 length:264 start_codon:yes stop_codon:yes gene_type:complete
VDRVSRKGEVLVFCYHKVNIPQGRVNVKRNYAKAIKKVMRTGMERIAAVPQKVNTSMFFFSKIEVTHMRSAPPTRKGIITASKKDMD